MTNKEYIKLLELKIEALKITRENLLNKLNTFKEEVLK
jgi:archaellum component FlaC